jgi:hypothetical protein
MFDYSILPVSLLPLLDQIRQGTRHMRDGVPGMLRRKMVRMRSLYDVELTARGELALRYLFVGSPVVVTEKHHLPQLAGSQGTIIGISDTTIDADGVDEYGFHIARAKASFRIDVLLDDHSGTWCFYRYDDLKVAREPLPNAEFPTSMPYGGYYG